MAIAFTTAPVATAGNGTSLIVPRSSTTAGRIALACIGLANGSITGIGAGWTLIAQSALFNTDDSISVFWRVVAGGDPSSWTFTSNAAAGSQRYAVIVLEFSGVDTTTPVDVTANQANASSVNAVAPSVDPNYLEDMLVFFGGASDIPTWTPDGAMVEPTNGEKQAAALISVGGAYQLLASGAATGTRTATLSAAKANAGMLVALKDAASTPDGGGGPTTIAVPLATASGAGFAPVAQAVAAVPVGSATGAGLLPTVQAVVAPPVAAATATTGTERYAVGSFPTVTGEPEGEPGTTAVGMLLGTLVAAAYAPTVRAVVSAPVGAAAGAGFAVTVVGPPDSGTFAVDLAAASALGPAPTVVARTAIDLAAAGAAGFVPAAALTVPLGTGSAAGLAPTVRVLVGPPLATATGAGFAVTVVGPAGAGTFSVDLAAASGAGFAPTLRAVASPPVGTATGAGLAPTVVTRFPVVLATASGQAFAPGLMLGVPRGGVAGTGAAPVLRAILTVALAQATAAGFAPELVEGQLVAIETEGWGTVADLIAAWGTVADLGASWGTVADLTTSWEH